MKKVLLMIVDALNTEVVMPAIENGTLPHLARLVELGGVRERNISIFPSLTPAATSSIITGRYPVEHRIFGFHWYDREEDEVAYHGDDFWVIAKMGFAEFFDGCLRKLNHGRLQAPTLFQTAELAGLNSASLNYLMFRGDHEHQARIPAWFSWLPSVPFETEVLGPELLFFGDMVDCLRENGHESPDREAGLLARFGFNDSNTARLLLHLAEQDRLANLNVAYFPDNDYQSHEVGSQAALPAVVKFDWVLGEFFERVGGIEAALERFHILVTGDHSQSQVVSDPKVAGILLEDLLQDFSVADAGSWPDDAILKVCPDMRCAQVYSRDDRTEFLAQVARAGLADERVDQAIWRRDDVYHVQTRAGSLRFADGPVLNRRLVTDVYGGVWSYEGELACVDGRLDGDKITFPGYPNAFERIAGCLMHPNSGDIWFTAVPGHEFKTKDTSVHVGGGSHGSLHRSDSCAPLIFAGRKHERLVPEQPRLVDLTPIILHLLGLPHREIGASHQPHFPATLTPA